MLLRDTLRKAGDVRRGQGIPAWSLDNPLPMGYAVKSVAGGNVVHGECHDGVGHLPVATQRPLQILTDARPLGNLLQQPNVTIQLVGVVIGVCWPACLSLTLKRCHLAHVPVVGKDEFSTLRQISRQERLVWVELVVLVNRSPVDTLVLVAPTCPVRVYY
ncbi:MAG: hypothetical protein ACI3YZ_08505, partial [Prevotella sp.]